MCSKIIFKENSFKPGDKVPVASSLKRNGAGIWSGFIRSDADPKTKGFWRVSGFTSALDVPATGFLERSRKTKVEVCAMVEDGQVIFAVGNRKRGEVKVLTRAATPEEKEKFGHDRVPLTGKRRF